MASFDTRLEAVAHRHIDAAIEDTLNTLSAGQLQTHADYKYHSGIIAGLRQAKAFLASALVEIQKG